SSSFILRLPAPTLFPYTTLFRSTVGAVLSTRELWSGLVPVKPATSVATARNSYCPSATVLVSKSAENGADVSTPICVQPDCPAGDRKSTRLNSSHRTISYAVFCL